MSSILYYSNFCEHSKKLLQTISKNNLSKDIHFICIDKRIKDSNNKTFIILENGQKIIMPENVNRVPALLLLNQGYKVLYGESILQHFKPQQEILVKKATQNNLEPLAFSFNDAGFGSVSSDQYSFLDMDSESLKATGNGGMRQMHNYVQLNHVDSFQPISKDEGKPSEHMTIEQLQKQREQDFSALNLPKK